MLTANMKALQSMVHKFTQKFYSSLQMSKLSAGLVVLCIDIYLNRI